jgi:formylmethanofuran dehydrogenase subunit C
VTLTLTLRESPPGLVDSSALDPEGLRGRSPREVARVSMRCGRRELAVGDLFEVSGTSDGYLFFQGDLSLVDSIGRGMGGGQIVVDGPCGDHVGAGMSSGAIVVNGTAGAWAGAELHGGVLVVRADAGARLGGAYPGARVGMTGGEIFVLGDGGEEAGAGLRRGLIAIGGRAGAGAGLRMLAGTVIALGGIGAEAGLGNKRGSLVSGRAAEPLPSYAFATRFQSPALRLQLLRLREVGLRVEDAMMTGTWARWSGDRTELTRGELLIFDEEEGSR